MITLESNIINLDKFDTFVSPDARYRTFWYVQMHCLELQHQDPSWVSAILIPTLVPAPLRTWRSEKFCNQKCDLNYWQTLSNAHMQLHHEYCMRIFDNSHYREYFVKRNSIYQYHLSIRCIFYCASTFISKSNSNTSSTVALKFPTCPLIISPFLKDFETF